MGEAETPRITNVEEIDAAMKPTSIEETEAAIEELERLGDEDLHSSSSGHDDNSHLDTRKNMLKPDDSDNKELPDIIKKCIATPHGFATVVFIVLFSVGAVMLSTYSEAREYQVASKDSWTATTCTVTDQGTVSSTRRRLGTRRRLRRSRSRSSSSGTDYKLKIGVLVDGFSDNEQVWAQKYAVWTTDKIDSSLKVFDYEYQAERFQENHVVGGEYPCYYKSGEGVAFRVGGSLYQDKVYTAWWLMAMSLVMLTFAILLKLYMVCGPMIGSMMGGGEGEATPASNEEAEEAEEISDENLFEGTVKDLQRRFPNEEEDVIRGALAETNWRLPGQAAKKLIVKDLQRRFPDVPEDVIKEACEKTEYEAEDGGCDGEKDGGKAAKLLSAQVASIRPESVVLGTVAAAAVAAVATGALACVALGALA